MQFIKNNAFSSSIRSAKNYPDGHIFKKDGSPALFDLRPKVDLGLRDCRDAMLEAHNNGVGQPARIYERSGDQFKSAVSEKSRSTTQINSSHNSLRAAYNALDIGLRDDVLPNCKCDSFSFANPEFPACKGVHNPSLPFTITGRQVLLYKAGDHFEPQEGRRGHADDSLFIDGDWRRNDVNRHFVGLLYLTNFTTSLNMGEENSHFTGGELIMHTLTEDGTNPIRIKPVFGQMIFFPASPMYLHSVPPITDGTRLVITTWYRVPKYS